MSERERGRELEIWKEWTQREREGGEGVLPETEEVGAAADAEAEAVAEGADLCCVVQFR